jgi:hypothetical protein
MQISTIYMRNVSYSSTLLERAQVRVRILMHPKHNSPGQALAANSQLGMLNIRHRHPNTGRRRIDDKKHRPQRNTFHCRMFGSWLLHSKPQICRQGKRCKSLAQRDYMSQVGSPCTQFHLVH